MPEEKKESFTFSDKIKNSKAAGNKSFAKSSSKIGRDGKPKQTLFERTRRDAPFFIAALVALLLLPFLYKFSGQSSEDVMTTPGSEEATFDPERYGFDTAMIEDPDGQIAQFAGRDSLKLIKGWGSNQEEDFGRDDMDFDAAASGEYDASRDYSANRSSSTNIDEEENITNIYKRRARAATRAAFRRTQIGSLNPATMRRGSGSRLGINNWGGSLKEAAKKVGASGPRNAPKPVSLQPLRAAGPARSSFGGGAAQAARKGLDNMGKANAVEALRDSYVKPVDPTRTGGIDLFSDGRSGGSGKLDHNINIGKGETPWWWDMMKTRMQKEWEARFERKWDWIKWADKLAQNILGNLINCIVTGDDGGDVDKFLGISAEGGSDPTCCGWSAKKLDPEKLAKVNGDVKKYCDSKVWKAELKAAGADCSRGYKGGVKTDVALGPVASRLKCLGLSVGGYASGDLGLNSASGLACSDMPTYNVIPSGQARKWNVYTYVVVRNYAPQALVDAGKITTRSTKNGNQYLLCGSSDRQHGGTSLEHNKATAGVGDVSAQDEGEVENVIVESKESSHVTTEQQQIRERYLEYDQESLRDACVIVVSRGNMLPYEQVKNQIMDLFMQKYNVNNETADKAFSQLDLIYVESFATKHKLAYAQWFETGHKLVNLLPMQYWEFENAYINHRKITHKKDGSKDKVYKTKWRIEDVDMVKGPKCYYDNLNIECGPEETNVAYVNFAPSFKGGDPGKTPTKDDISVSAQFVDVKGVEGIEQTMIRPEVEDYKFTYTFSRILSTTPAQTLLNITDGSRDNNEAGLIGTIRWTVTRGAQIITKNCPLNTSGDGYSVTVPPKECPQGPQTSQECCEQAAQNDPNNEYTWENGQCKITPKQPETPQPGNKFTLFAPGIKCVPQSATGRKERPAGSMDEQTMCTTLFENPLVKQYNTTGQSCHDLWGFTMDSSKATAFVNQVKEAYNNAHPDLPIKFDKTYPQDAEFVDALNVAQSVGITEVPMAAVCELGRDFVRMSKDKHAGDRSIIENSTGTKQEPLIFRNELGAFLAYIHDTSILYPDAYVRVNGSNYCDWRFQPFGLGDGGCAKNGGPKMGKGYAHNNYNGTNFANKYSNYFVPSLTPTMKAAPLKALVAGHGDLPHNCGNCKSMGGNNYVKKYNSYEGFAGLLHEQNESTNNQGVACEAFLGGNKDAKMQVADVLKYVEGLCTAGLDYKPIGQGRAEYVEGQGPTSSGGSSGGDEVTGQPIGS